jgi:glycosyltransferase involved in cell wall biosynthesis
MTTIYAIPAKIIESLPLISSTVADSERRYSNFSISTVFFKIACYYSDIIISNSAAGLKAYGINNSKRSLVIYNGVNIDRFQGFYDVMHIKSDLGISTKYIVVMVAAFTDRKDWDLLLNVAKIYYSKRSDVSFLCIGDGEDFNRIMHRKNNEDIGNVFLIGKKKNVEKYISISDIGLLCTYAEGISNSIIEYMALNKPVIVTDKFGGSVELVEEGVTGFCVDRDENQVIDKIDLLIEDSQLRKSMGQLGKKKIEESFSIEKMGKEYYTLYQGFAKSSDLLKKLP